MTHLKDLSPSIQDCPPSMANQTREKKANEKVVSGRVGLEKADTDELRDDNERALSDFISALPTRSLGTA